MVFYGIMALVLVCIIDLGKKYILDKENIKPDELVLYMSMTGSTSRRKCSCQGIPAKSVKTEHVGNN